MLYKRILKIKEDTQSNINLKVAHWYLRLLEGIPTLHAEVLQWVFVEFGDSYTLLNVHNIFEKLELAHAHYEASTMKPSSRSRPEPPLTMPTKSSHSSSRTKAVHLATPILPFCNYYGNPFTKLMSATFLSRISLVIIVGKRDIRKLYVLPSFSKRKQLRSPWQNLPTSSVTPQPKAKAP
jgi:hypothetical protein